MTHSPPLSPEPLAWYVRDELAGAWRIAACPEHGRALERHRFRKVGPEVELPGGRVRRAGSCEPCRRVETLEEVDRCTCENDPARCPVHQNIGCGG